MQTSLEELYMRHTTLLKHMSAILLAMGVPCTMKAMDTKDLIAFTCAQHEWNACADSIADKEPRMQQAHVLPHILRVLKTPSAYGCSLHIQALFTSRLLDLPAVKELLAYHLEAYTDSFQEFVFALREHAALVMLHILSKIDDRRPDARTQRTQQVLQLLSKHNFNTTAQWHAARILKDHASLFATDTQRHDEAYTMLARDLVSLTDLVFPNGSALPYVYEATIHLITETATWGIQEHSSATTRHIRAVCTRALGCADHGDQQAPTQSPSVIFATSRL